MNVRFDPYEVGAHLGPCCVRVARCDRIADRTVLVERPFWTAGHQKDRHQRAPDHSAQRVHGMQDDAVARCLRDRQMETQVSVDVVRTAVVIVDPPRKA